MRDIPEPGTVVDLDDGNLYRADSFPIPEDGWNTAAAMQSARCKQCDLTVGSRACFSVRCCSGTRNRVTPWRRVVFKRIPR